MQIILDRLLYVTLALWVMAAFLVGCGPEPAFQTKYGNDVYIEEYTDYPVVREHVDLMMDVVKDAFLIAYNPRFANRDVHSVYRDEHTYIYFVRDPLACGTNKQPDRTCAGIFDYGWLSSSMYIHVNHRCIAWTAFAHEWTHALAHHLLGDSDMYHKNPALFGKDGVTQWALKEGLRLMCPNG